MLLWGSVTVWTQAIVPMPEIRQNGVVKQLFVDGKPFIMLAALEALELCSSPLST
jgi:hypothetical protein